MKRLFSCSFNQMILCVTRFTHTFTLSFTFMPSTSEYRALDTSLARSYHMIYSANHLRPSGPTTFPLASFLRVLFISCRCEFLFSSNDSLQNSFRTKSTCKLTPTLKPRSTEMSTWPGGGRKRETKKSIYRVTFVSIV